MQAIKKESINLDVALWKANLRDALSSAKNREDVIALKCFEKALSPLFEHPEKLRTLLGKIAMAV